MASGDSDQDVKDALSKLLQIGTVAEYESKFVILANRVTRISENLLKSFYISGLKPTLQCALLRSNPTTLGEAFSLARATEARFAEDALSRLLQMGTVAEYHNQLTPALQIELLIARPTTLVEAFSLAQFTSDNDARDQASEVETKVLVDGKQDAAKVVKVVVVVVEQNNDEPNVLEGNGGIGVGVNEINKWVDKEVQYSVSILHVLIPLLKRLNDKHIKKKKMKAEIQRRIWNPGDLCSKPHKNLNFLLRWREGRLALAFTTMSLDEDSEEDEEDCFVTSIKRRSGSGEGTSKGLPKKARHKGPIDMFFARKPEDVLTGGRNMINFENEWGMNGYYCC
ncbi:hypothetical protein Tco_1328179 [Tanacetum coccineum]